MLNMRQAAYISILIGLWLFSMAALMLGMDSLGIRPSFRTRFSVALAEELVEWLSQKASKSTALLPPRCHAGLARR